MASGWTLETEPPVSEANVVTLVEQTTFCLCSRNGNIHALSAQGLFFHDTRIVSHWVLTVDGAELEPLTVVSKNPYHANFITRAHLRDGQNNALLIERRRYVGNGMREDLVASNVTDKRLTAELRLLAGADFADLFHVKDGVSHANSATGQKISSTELIIRKPDDEQQRSIRISIVGGEPLLDQQGVRFLIDIPARSTWSASIVIHPQIDEHEFTPAYPFNRSLSEAPAAQRTREWDEQSPQVQSPDASLINILSTSLRDLGALRIFDPEEPQTVTIAAGAPWFMALFGRDSLLTSLMALPLDPGLALGTLRSLARRQGITKNPLTEEEPGRILHEVRLGSDAKIALGGGQVYYGTVDATPLFVILLGELRRWGLGEEHLEELLPAADKALNWLQTYGNRTGDGFVRYQRSSATGLINQGWKDSADGISFADGRLPQTPIALCEVQAYTYAAYTARSHLARELGDTSNQERWAEAATKLRVAFNRHFWLNDKEWYAVALDANGTPVDSLTSNIGHCLWAGIIDEDKAQIVADHLLSSEMFTGWGIRTLSSSMNRYNPMGYHNGSVWPHDNAIIASGLMRYGFVEEAQKIALGLLDAARAFDGRLPELFCGFDRATFDQPIPFPTSCSPQAWAAAAPIHLLRTLLRFNPSVSQGTVCLEPSVPDHMLPMTIDNLAVGNARLRIEIDHDGVHVEGLTPSLKLCPAMPATAC